MTQAQRQVLEAMAARKELYRMSLDHRGWVMGDSTGRDPGWIQQRTARPMFDAGWIAYTDDKPLGPARITPAGRAALQERA